MDRNIGTNSETDAGLYFQFGDIVVYRDATHSTFITYPSVPNSDNDLDKSLAEVWLKEGNYILLGTKQYSCLTKK